MFWKRGLAFVLLAGLPLIAMAEPAEAPEPGPSASQAGGDAAFDIFEYVVEGNSVLPELAIEQAVYPHLGEKKSIQDVKLASKALEKAYHDAGYLTVFVDIPEQDIRNNIVRLAVTEGRVERLKVSGARYYSLGRIKSKAPDLAEGTVPYFPSVQKQVASVNRNADRKVTPVLRPGRSPGTVEVELKVADQLPLHANLELNNRYSPNTTKTRLSGGVRYDNLWQREHSVSLQFQTAPERTEDTKVFSANYVVPFANGDYLAAYGVSSNSDTAALGDVNVIGDGRIFGLRYIRPLRSRQGFFHTATAGWDYKGFNETVNLLGADSFNTPISYRALSLAYEATLQSEARSTQFAAAFNFSVRGVGNTANQFALKRYNARASYAYLRLDLKHTEKLPGGYSLFGRVGAQLAGSPLISNEQYSAGGAGSVRGYLESEALGDKGLQAGLELRTPPFSRDAASFWRQTYALGFIEGARLETLEPLPDQQSTFTFSSTGLGLRMKAAKGFTLDMDLALPLKQTGNTPARDVRVQWRMAYEY